MLPDELCIFQAKNLILLGCSTGPHKHIAILTKHEDYPNYNKT